MWIPFENVSSVLDPLNVWQQGKYTPWKLSYTPQLPVCVLGSDGIQSGYQMVESRNRLRAVAEVRRMKWVISVLNFATEGKGEPSSEQEANVKSSTSQRKT